MSRDNWKPLPAAEWKRRLSKARAIATQRLALDGLELLQGEAGDIADLLAYNGDVDSPVGLLLNPDLAVARRKLDEAIDPAFVQDADVGEAVCGYSIHLATTAFLFGVITGCHLTWPVIEATPAPYAPPKKRTTKGGAR